MRSFVTAALAATAAVLPLARAGVAGTSLPIVDLGYEVHQAIGYDDYFQGAYNFTNIRFGQAPVGELRFVAPKAPTGRNKTVVNGDFIANCPQALPSWEPIAEAFAAAFAAGKESAFNYTAAVAALSAASSSSSTSAELAALTAGVSEDCLFLDVHVPKNVFNKVKSSKKYGGVPVLVWIYGGGYVEGSKNQNNQYDPSGLLNASVANGDDGVVFVALNYRLGAFGWSGGPTFQQQGGTSNAGLYDQRLALEWVQQYIHLFGGDPNQVTIMGESAGGGSVMHQITAYGGLKPVPFQRAIPQSPGWLPITNQLTQENNTLNFFKYLNVSTLAEAQALPSEAVILGNILQILNAPYGQYIYGPTVDGVFVPTQPSLALLAGISFAKNITVMAGHNKNEGPAFTPPYVRTDADLTEYLKIAFPTAQESQIAYVVNDLYPAVYDGTYPWTTPIDRTIRLVTEVIFVCNTNYLARAYNNQTYNYLFEVAPALHGFDVPSTFYLGEGTNLTESIYAPVAEAMQRYITNFVMTGNPNTPGLVTANGETIPEFPMYGSNATVMMFNYTVTSPTTVSPFIQTGPDDTDNERCYFWQKDLLL